MKNEDNIAELLSEMLIRQDRFESALDKITYEVEKLGSAWYGLGSAWYRLG